MRFCVLLLVTIVAALLGVSRATADWAYYPFVNGSAIDATGNSHNGVINGATPCPDRFGNPNMAFHISSTQNIYVADPPEFTNAGTFAAWVYLDQGGTGGYIMNKGTYLQLAPYGLVIDDSVPTAPKLQARAYVGGTDYHATSSHILPEQTWVHVAGVFDSTSGLKLYVNGVQEAFQPISGSLISQPNLPLVFGGDIGNSGSFIQGSVDEIRIYDSAFTAAQIQQLVPEPTSLALVGVGAVGCAYVWRRRRHAAKV